MKVIGFIKWLLNLISKHMGPDFGLPLYLKSAELVWLTSTPNKL